MNKFFPILTWLPKYNRSLLAGDLSAGLTVGIMLIPQGMAYALLAGLPPIYGLYASTIPLILYAILGTSRQLAVGPVAMVALLVASGVGEIAKIGSPEFVTLAILLALMVGTFQFLLGVFKLGFLVNFLSHPVIAGFTSAAAIIIGFSQLKHLLGLDIPRGKVHETLYNVYENIGDINLPTLFIGVGAILVLLILRRINKRIPSPLIIVILGVGAVMLLGLEVQGVKIIKDVPSGFPAFSIPALEVGSLSQLLPIAVTIALVGYMESYAVAKAIQKKHKDYEIDSNQELIALGAANIGGAFFQAFPTTGGFSRTAVNDQAGAKTGMAAIFSAGVVIATLLFLTEYFYFLPKAVLAAIIMVAVFGLIDLKEAKHLWRTDKYDFAAFMITALATLTLGIEEGILIGVLFSIVVVIYKISYPHIAEVGKVPGSTSFRNITRFEGLQQFEDTLILRFDAQIYFANAELFKSHILKSVMDRPEINNLVIDAGMINNIDSSAAHMLFDLHQELEVRQVQLILCDVKGPVRDQLRKTNLFDLIGSDHFFLTVDEAISNIYEGETSQYLSYTNQFQH